MRYLLTTSWGDDPNPHPMTASQIFETFEEANEAGERYVRGDMDANYCVVVYDERLLIDAVELIDKITKYREEIWHDALAMYCAGYEAAAQATTEELEAIFEEDNWGDLWANLNGAQAIFWEQDDGRMEAYNNVLRLLGVKTNEGGL